MESVVPSNQLLDLTLQVSKLLLHSTMSVQVRFTDSDTALRMLMAGLISHLLLTLRQQLSHKDHQHLSLTAALPTRLPLICLKLIRMVEMTYISTKSMSMAVANHLNTLK